MSPIPSRTTSAQVRGRSEPATYSIDLCSLSARVGILTRGRVRLQGFKRRWSRRLVKFSSLACWRGDGSATVCKKARSQGLSIQAAKAQEFLESLGDSAVVLRRLWAEVAFSSAAQVHVACRMAPRTICAVFGSRFAANARDHIQMVTRAGLSPDRPSMAGRI